MKRNADLVPVNVTFAEATESPLLSPVLDVEFDRAVTEGADPFFGGSELLHIPNVKISTHPWIVEGIEIVAEFVG